MENTFENALEYTRQLKSMSETYFNDEKRIATAMLSYAAKTAKIGICTEFIKNKEYDSNYCSYCGNHKSEH